MRKKEEEAAGGYRRRLYATPPSWRRATRALASAHPRRTRANGSQPSRRAARTLAD